MRKTQVIINNPCSQNWDHMVPDTKGRFCDVCQLSVIDFTEKTPEEIRAYLSCQSGERVCGRFKSGDVRTGAQPSGSGFSKMARVLSALVLGLLIITGCKTRKPSHTTGAPLMDDAHDKTESVK
jgi:hypothetical protein